MTRGEKCVARPASSSNLSGVARNEDSVIFGRMNGNGFRGFTLASALAFASAPGFAMMADFDSHIEKGLLEVLLDRLPVLLHDGISVLLQDGLADILLKDGPDVKAPAGLHSIFVILCMAVFCASSSENGGVHCRRRAIVDCSSVGFMSVL